MHVSVNASGRTMEKVQQLHESILHLTGFTSYNSYSFFSMACKTENATILNKLVQFKKGDADILVAMTGQGGVVFLNKLS